MLLRINTRHSYLYESSRVAAVNVDVLDWAEVDDPNDLSIAEFLFNSKERAEILDKSHGGYWNYPITDYCYIRNAYYPTNSMFAHFRNSRKN